MICEFPSDEFYDGRLEADPSVLQHFCALEGFWPGSPQCPIAFCDIVGKEEGTDQESIHNRIEAFKIVINMHYTCVIISMFTGGYHYSIENG